EAGRPALDGLPPLFLVLLQRRWAPGEEAGIAAALCEHGTRVAGALQQVERDRSLVREQPEQLHVTERELDLEGAVEHLEDAECALVVQERPGQHRPRDGAAGRRLRARGARGPRGG